jgi:hypothetical protein
VAHLLDPRRPWRRPTGRFLSTHALAFVSGVFRSRFARPLREARWRIFLENTVVHGARAHREAKREQPE